MPHAIILGIGSDIGREIAMRLLRDKWDVVGVRRNELVPKRAWDLIVCCYGTLEPIGAFWDTSDHAWERAVHINTLLPLRQIKALYPHRRPGASVCLFSGAGANGPAPTYSAYCASKIMLTKMTELMDAESEDCKFFILGPGMMRTKIQEQTLRAGPKIAANFQRVSEFMASSGRGTPHDDVYACLRACMAAPKAAVGGRNIYVPMDDWQNLEPLAGAPDVFKLRRAGDAALRRAK